MPFSFKSLAAFVFVLSPALAWGQDISIKMEQIPKGSWFLMDENGQDAMHVFRGKQGRHYIYDYVPGRNPNAAQHFRDLRDAQGNVVKRTYADGRVVTNTPHNCQRVIGQCAFVESGDNNGQRYETKMVRVNTPTGKGFSFKQVAISKDGTQHHVRSGVVRSLDGRGMLIRANMKTSSSKQNRVFRKISASWD